MCFGLLWSAFACFGLLLFALVCFCLLLLLLLALVCFGLLWQFSLSRDFHLTFYFDYKRAKAKGCVFLKLGFMVMTPPCSHMILCFWHCRHSAGSVTLTYSWSFVGNSRFVTPSLMEPPAYLQSALFERLKKPNEKCKQKCIFLFKV